jgi:hypothetical protein
MPVSSTFATKSLAATTLALRYLTLTYAKTLYRRFLRREGLDNQAIDAQIQALKEFQRHLVNAQDSAKIAAIFEQSTINSPRT